MGAEKKVIDKLYKDKWEIPLVGDIPGGEGSDDGLEFPKWVRLFCFVVSEMLAVLLWGELSLELLFFNKVVFKSCIEFVKEMMKERMVRGEISHRILHSTQWPFPWKGR